MQPVWFGAVQAGRPSAGRSAVTADRPAHDIGRDDALGDRLAGDLFAQQPLEVQRALAVPREDDRPVARFLDELVERGGYVLVCKIERFLRVLALQQERAKAAWR